MRLPILAVAAALATPGAPWAQTDALSQGAELRRAGRVAEAIPLLETATRAAPKDADAWLNLGLAYSAAERLGDAERALMRAQALSPDYADVRLARARVAFFRGDRAEAERRLAPLLGKDNAEAEALAAQIREARTAARAERWRLDATAIYGERSKGLNATNSGLLALSRKRGETTLGGQVEQVRQFGASDTYVEGLVTGRIGYIALGGTPSADFRPEWSVRAGTQSPAWTVGGTWSAYVAADGVYSRYPVGSVWGLHPSMTLARGEDVTLTVRWINVVDEANQYRSGYALRAVVRAAPGVMLSAGWAAAPESSEGVTTRVKTASLGAAFDVSKGLTLRVDGAREDRPAYKHDVISVGFTRTW